MGNGLLQMRTGQGRDSCIVVSEVSGILATQGRVSAVPASEIPAEGEPVFLSLRNACILLLSANTTSAPYAFLRMQDADILDVRRGQRQLVLAGRSRDAETVADGNRGECTRHVCAPGYPVTRQADFSSAGVAARKPLPMCFLLADGRFESFDANWLELQFETDESLVQWSQELDASITSSIYHGYLYTGEQPEDECADEVLVPRGVSAGGVVSPTANGRADQPRDTPMDSPSNGAGDLLKDGKFLPSKQVQSQRAHAPTDDPLPDSAGTSRWKRVVRGRICRRVVQRSR